MGTGKTSVGKLLAKKMKFNFLDTDNQIEKREGLSIPEIFANKGEDYFRSLEEKVLADIINTEQNFVLATGGGIVISPKNRKLLLNSTKSFLLEAGPEEIYRRTKADSERPLLETDNPLQKIKELLAERREYYQCFPNKIDTEEKLPVEIVEDIYLKI